MQVAAELMLTPVALKPKREFAWAAVTDQKTKGFEEFVV